MEITFSLPYSTHWGECVYIDLHSDHETFYQSKPLLLKELGYWQITIQISDKIKSFSYRYLIKANDTVVKQEWGKERCFISTDKELYRIYDRWQDMPHDSSFYSSAFTEVILAHPALERTTSKFLQTLTLLVDAPRILPDEDIYLIGEGSALGNWDTAKAKRLLPSPFPQWRIDIDASKITAGAAYKFICKKKKYPNEVIWEKGENRTLLFEPISAHEQAILACGELRLGDPHWKGSGVAIPLFSLRSNESFGIGDFIDLKKLANWAIETGQKVIQILPVNDTTMTHTWTDSYPYNANSTFALHPLYLNPYRMGTLKDSATLKKVEELRKQLNELSEVDYEGVALLKWDYFKVLYQESGQSTLTSDEYCRFFEQNREWLVPYGAFCFLRDRYQTADFRLWPEYSRFDRNDVEELCTPGNFHYPEIAIHFFLQFHLHKQLCEACNYIRSKGIILKGDIPIGISRNSVDAWAENHLFNMECQAGAPPDDFSATGQNWGFPTYNWQVMETDHYAWWRKRFQKMADYFDAYRIDHILGFFRIWEIPIDAVSGLLGHFNPALPLSVQDMEQYGFWFDYHRMAEPYIKRYLLNDLFHEYTEEVISLYLTETGYDTFALKPDVSTQKGILQLFPNKANAKNETIKNGLMQLVEEVLFVKDPYQEGKFHPRISAQFSSSFRALDPHQQHCFNRMYDNFYYHRHNEFWKFEAMKKLPHLISATSMLVCAEDLGMIPHSVPEVLSALQILSLEIQRMPKESYQRFADSWHYPYLSVCSTSTHDMAPLRVWWEEDRERTQYFYNYILHESGEAPFYCEPWIGEKIILQQLRSPSMLAIFPLQDWLSIDGSIRRESPQAERINVPANPQHYWRYRMHLTLEELIVCSDFNQKVAHLISEAGR